MSQNITKSKHFKHMLALVVFGLEGLNKTNYCDDHIYSVDASKSENRSRGRGMMVFMGLSMCFVCVFVELGLVAPEKLQVAT